MMLKQTSDNTEQRKTNAERVQGRESSRSLSGLGLRGVTSTSRRGRTRAEVRQGRRGPGGAREGPRQDCTEGLHGSEVGHSGRVPSALRSDLGG